MSDSKEKEVTAAQLDRGCIQRLCEEFLCDISQGKLTKKLARDYVAKVQMELDRACFPKSIRATLPSEKEPKP
jgi:hypothetical protein